MVHVVGELPQSAPHSLLPLVAAGQLQTARSATRRGITFLGIEGKWGLKFDGGKVKRRAVKTWLVCQFFPPGRHVMVTQENIFYIDN